MFLTALSSVLGPYFAHCTFPSTVHHFIFLLKLPPLRWWRETFFLYPIHSSTTNDYKMLLKKYLFRKVPSSWHSSLYFIQDTTLLQGGPRDAAVNFGTYPSLKWHRTVFTAIATFLN